MRCGPRVVGAKWWSLVFLGAVATTAALAGGDIWSDREVANAHRTFQAVSADPDHPNVWYALDGSRGWTNVYASYNAGKSWRIISGIGAHDRTGEGPTALAWDPASPGVLFATVMGVTHRSSDGAKTWADDPAKLVRVDGRWLVHRGEPWNPPAAARAFARDPSNTDLLYAGTEKGVYASADGGKTWEQRNAWLEDPNVLDLRVDPGNTQALVALTRRTVFRSANGGRMWSKVAAPWSCCGDYDTIVRDSSDGLLVHADNGELKLVSATGVSRTRQGCDAVDVSGDLIICESENRVDVLGPDGDWQEHTLDFARPDVLRLRQDGAGTIYAELNGGGVLASSDVRSWTALLNRAPAMDLAMDPTGSGVWFVAATDGLWMKKSPTEDLDRRVDVGAMAVIFDPSAPGRLWAAFIDGTVRRSDDMGWSFQTMSNGLPKAGVYDLALDPSGNGVIWAAVSGDGVYRSADGGKSWAPAGQSAGSTSVRRLALDPSNPDSVWAAAWADGLYHSPDGGASWQRADLPCHVVYDVTLHPVRPENIAVGCEDGQIMVSADAGASWTKAPHMVNGDVLSVLYATGSVEGLVVGSSAGEVVMAASPGGATPAAAVAAATPAAVVTNDRFRNIRVDMMAVDSDESFAAISTPDGIFVTHDAGKHWDRIAENNWVVTGLDVSEGRVLVWAKGRGLEFWDGRDWRAQDAPEIPLDGCSARASRDYAALVSIKGSGRIVVQGHTEYYRSGDGPWQARGDVNCTTPDHKLRLQLVPPIRDETWNRMSLTLGTDIPGKTARTIEKASGARPRAMMPRGDGSDIVFTSNKEFGTFDGYNWKKTGDMPAGTLCLAWGTADDGRVYVGTEHGILMSSDSGATFQPW